MATTERATTDQDSNHRRTNSLAFASTDCHKCIGDGVACDRLRPRCSICETKGLKCPGFVTPLSWDDRRMLVAQPGARITMDNDEDLLVEQQQASKAQPSTELNVQKKFRFVEKPATKRRRVTNQASGQTARTPKITTRKLATEQPSVSVMADDPAHLTGEQHVYGIQAAHPSFNETQFTVDSVEALPSHECAAGSQSTSQIQHSFAPNLTSTDFEPNTSWDELVESACSLDASDSSQYDMELGDDFSVPQVAGPAPVSTTGSCGIELSTTANDPRAGLDSRINFTPWYGLRDLMQGQTHGSVLSQGPSDSPNNPLCIPHSVEPFYDILLNMYDSELCILPVTGDMKMNPFRCQKETSRGSRLLYHSIMALAYQHLNYTTSSWPKEASEHRSRASEEFILALANLHSGGSPLHLLDSILIMFTLECTLSASGPWTYHLMQAVTVLEAAGGAAALQSPRLRSQVAMLLWWDSTLALVSRQGLVIGTSYYEYLLDHEQRDEWSFYDLSGCPKVLFRLLVDLAQLAAQQEIAQNMQYLKFDPSPVYAIEQQLRELNLDERGYKRGGTQSSTQRHSNSGFCVDIDGEGSSDLRAEEEDINRQSDTYHCLEAWRHGLLTYTYRVFLLNRTKHGLRAESRTSNAQRAPSQLWTSTSQQSKCSKPSKPSSLRQSPDVRRVTQRMLLQSARETLSHVRAVRQSSQTQKQLLLPIFWAGSETSDPELRDFAHKYCEWWADKSRYQMFLSVSSVFCEIWEQLDKCAGYSEGKEMPWWGTVIDNKTKGGPGVQKTGIHFLFG